MGIAESMIDGRDMEEMRSIFHKYDEQRELLIKKSRDVLKLSKQIIYAVHRDNLADAEKLIKDIQKEKAALEKIAGHSIMMEAEGSFKVALQEYAEALIYYLVIRKKKLPARKDLKINALHYVLGLCDVTGELVRKAVYLAGKDSYSEVVLIRDLVDEIYGQLLYFDFRDHEVRRKFDSVKYDLKKLEDLVLELKIKGKLA